MAAHYCFDHVTLDGIVAPTFRRVVKSKSEGPNIHGPTAVLIVISDVSLSGGRAFNGHRDTGAVGLLATINVEARTASVEGK